MNEALSSTIIERANVLCAALNALVFIIVRERAVGMRITGCTAKEAAAAIAEQALHPASKALDFALSSLNSAEAAPHRHVAIDEVLAVSRAQDTLQHVINLIS